MSRACMIMSGPLSGRVRTWTHLVTSEVDFVAPLVAEIIGVMNGFATWLDQHALPQFSQWPDPRLWDVHDMEGPGSQAVVELEPRDRYEMTCCPLADMDMDSSSESVQHVVPYCAGAVPA